MLTASEILVEGEKFIGDYNIQIARWKVDHWVSTIPPLYLILSDHRIILQPHARKRYEPAIIPLSYIVNVTELETDLRHGILLHLKTNHRIGMFVPRDHKTQMLRNLRAMKAPPAPVRFEPQLDLRSIQKMIEVISDM